MRVRVPPSAPKITQQNRPRSDRSSLRRPWRLVFIGLGLACIGGCSYSDDLASAMVAPGQFILYNCDQLTTRGRETSRRAQELKELMDKSARSTGGELVNALAYRNDYLTARGELMQLEATAAEKNCPVTWKSVSDRSMW